jgi:acetyl esterase/lipase
MVKAKGINVRIAANSVYLPVSETNQKNRCQTCLAFLYAKDAGQAMSHHEHKHKASLRGRLAFRLVRSVVRGWPLDDNAALVRRARRIFERHSLLRDLLVRGITIEPVNAEVKGEWHKPKKLRLPDSVLLYFHGGGYVSCSPRTHRPITAALARRIGCRVFSLDYRRAPEHPFPAPVEDALNAVQWLLKSGIKPEKLALAGDSAGGGLAIATLVQLRDRGDPLPACAACISPWVDLLGEYKVTNPKSCAMFTFEEGRCFAKVYLNGASGSSPMASPVMADLHGLPPLLIQAADTELLYDDAVRLNEKALASGVQSRLHIYPGMPHVWQMFGMALPEASAALKEIAEFISEKIGASAQTAVR